MRGLWLGVGKDKIPPPTIIQWWWWRGRGRIKFWQSTWHLLLFTGKSGTNFNIALEIGTMLLSSMLLKNRFFPITWHSVYKIYVSLLVLALYSIKCNAIINRQLYDSETDLLKSFSVSRASSPWPRRSKCLSSMSRAMIFSNSWLSAWLEWVTISVRWAGKLWYRLLMICTATSVFPVPGGPTTWVVKINNTTVGTH